MLKQALRRRTSAVWLSAAAVGLLAMGLAGVSLGLSLIPLALGAESRVREFTDIPVAGIVEGDANTLAELQARLEDIGADVAPAARDMRWVARFSPSTRWLPLLDQEAEAWSRQVERLSADLESASALLTASSRLIEAYDDVQASLLRDGAVSRTHDPGSLESSFAEAFGAVTKTAREGKKFRPALELPRVSRALTLLDELEDKMLTTSQMGGQASALLAELAAVSGDAQPLLRHFVSGGGDTPPLDTGELKDALVTLDRGVQFALARSDGLARLAAESQEGGTLMPRLALLRELLGALMAINRSAMVAIRTVEPALTSAAGQTGGLLGKGGSLLQVLDAAADNEAEIAEAISLLDGAESALRQVEAGSVGSQDFPGLRELVDATEMLREGLSLVVDMAPAARELLAVDTARQYLVLGQSADELRATGGFVSAAWLVTFAGGALAEIRYHDIVLVDDSERFMLYPPAPEALEEHMSARVWLLRDVSWEPDFPTTARTAADIYRVGQRREVDGVVALNQWTFLEVVEALGDVPSPDGGPPITSRNLLSKLEEETDAHGRAYMDVMLQGVFDHLDRPMSLEGLMRLAAAVYTSLRERDLLVYMNDPDTQSLIEAHGWAGSLRDSASDYLYVVDSNVGWSKADRNIERRLSYQVDLRKKAGPRIKLTLRYNNHGGPGSPGCEPQWLNRGTDYSQLKNACYWDYWRAYVPQGARLLSNTPLPLPEYSVSAEIGLGRPGEDTVRLTSSFRRSVLSGLFALGVGWANEVQLVYDLPPGVVTREGDQIRYELLIQKQPGARRRDVSVELLLPDGYRLAFGSLTPSATSDSAVEFTFPVESDMILTTVFTRGGDGLE